MVRTPFKIKACYSIPELARMAGLSRHKMRRLLIAGGVPFDKQGSDIVISQPELREAMPRLWEGIEYRLSLGALNQETEPGTLSRLIAIEERVEELESMVRRSS